VRKPNTLVWLAVVALLGGIYFYETYHENQARLLEQERKTLFEIKPSQVHEIRLEKATQAIVLKRRQRDEGDGWYIKKPVRAKADPKAVKEILGTLTSLRYIRLISPGELEEMASFGLDRPQLAISLSHENGRSTIAIGNKTPTGQSYYAKKEGRHEVFTISDYAVALLDKGLFDLRNKRLFGISFGQVKEIFLWKGSKGWRFVKKKGQWYLEEPEKLPGAVIDQERISNIVRSFVEAEALSFENDQDPAAFGLREPKAGAIIKAQGQREKLLFGDLVPGDETRIYAKTAPKGLVVTVGTWLFREIPLHENLFLATTRP